MSVTTTPTAWTVTAGNMAATVQLTPDGFRFDIDPIPGILPNRLTDTLPTPELSLSFVETLFGELLAAQQAYDEARAAAEQARAQAEYVATRAVGMLNWSADLGRVFVGEIFWYEEIQYRVIQEHDTQEGWHPPAVPALFEPV